MNFFTEFFPATFPALALAHFLALLSPGPDFFLIVGHGIRHRLKGSAFICLGIALGNAVYITMVIAGWSGIKQYPLLYRGLEMAGGAYLIWMGIMLWKAGGHKAEITVEETGALGPLSQLAAGLGSALLNPKNMIFYLTLMTVIIGPKATLKQQAVSGLWMFLVVLMWDLALCACLSRPVVQRALKTAIPLVERTAGVVLISLAAFILINPTT